jgi:dihydrodipicolinate synthase/N-acetylneuraminate lyase
VLAYHYPAVSPPGIPVDALADLPVVGCKDSSGDADRLRRTAAVWPRALYPGSSALVGLAGELRCAGVILAVANSHPELCVSAFAGDRVAQRDLLTLHLPGVDPITATKRMTAARFGTSSATRAPVA